MSAYVFLPWMRRGLATRAGESVVPGRQRAGFDVALRLQGQGVGADVSADVIKRVELFGPGDITGIQKRVIVRTEPRDLVSDFEPNMLAHIEFYDEALPWLYAPGRVEGAGAQLKPWIALVVLVEHEFKEARAATTRPTPFIEVQDLSVLPPLEESWAWAHVHVVGNMLGAAVRLDDRNAAAAQLDAASRENRDRVFSRLICPRRLDENVAYHAFVVPTFESGRLAGLMLNPANAPSAEHGAWVDYPSGSRPEATSLPYYFRWRFRTGPVGDFEHLARILTPRALDGAQASRPFDLTRPGSGLPPILDPPLAGVLPLPGALQPPRGGLPSPETQPLKAYDALTYPQPFQTAMARFVNLRADYEARGVATAHGAIPVPDFGPDPVITPPVYGAWHAAQHRLLEAADGAPLTNRDNWLHELNLDPRWRTAAGYGTRVMQQNQEEYMDAAWAQVGDLRPAVSRVRLSVFARLTAESMYTRTFTPIAAGSPGRYAAIAAPMLSRLRGPVGLTLHAAVEDSRVPLAALSPPARRIARPRGRLARKLAFTPEAPVQEIVARINDGRALPAPEKVVAPAIGKLDDVVAKLEPPPGAAFGLFRWLEAHPLGAMLLLLFALAALLILALFGGLAAAGGALAFVVGTITAYAQWRRRRNDAAALSPRGLTPAAVDDFPRRPGFTYAQGPGAPAPTVLPGADSPEAARFKAGLKPAYALIEEAHRRATATPRAALDLADFAAVAHKGLAPSLTVRRWLSGTLVIPPRIIAELGETFDEPMAYPRIDVPMYASLRDISAELLIPNLNLIPRNTITLMETNQRFIESYMVGLNHECGRELLWREYPTDQRGTPFRQFWDVSEALKSARPPAAGADPRETFYDIPPIHRWGRSSRLGGHDNRQTGSTPREELVLVIRGDLLKRYPNAVVYAQKAKWPSPLVDGKPDRSKERELIDLSDAERASKVPPADKMRTPLYSAKIDPDVICLGFDLTEGEARGGPGESASDPAGWFFVIEERPGEPRFGADLDGPARLNVWNDLSWADIAPGGARYIKAIRGSADAPTLQVQEPAGAAAEKRPQWLEDRALTWGPNVDSGQIAYMLCQVPVRVAIHAEKMLGPRMGGSA
jgi:hypothetical protein